MDIVERFWTKVDRSGGPDACWPWTKGKRGNYGSYTYKINGKSCCSSAHHFAWSAVNGKIPAGQWVLHKCDNPICCNPAHLFAGTPADNTKDKNNKGRGNYKPPIGEKSGQHKLTKFQVDEIRQLTAGGATKNELAKMFHVTPQYIGQIARNKWRKNA